jgi:uncharacterized membrane protein (DUF2068 family)
MDTQRPLPVTSAAILLALFSLLSLPLPLLPGAEAVPAVVLYEGTVLSIVGLVTAVGLWIMKKWSLWLTIVVSVLNILSSAPGLVMTPDAASKAIVVVGIVVPALIIMLVVLPTSRRTFVGA